MNVGSTSWAGAVYYLKSFTYSKGLESTVCFQRSAASRGSENFQFEVLYWRSLTVCVEF